MGLAVAVVTLLDSLLLALLRFIPSYLTVLAGVVLALALTWLLSLACRKPLGVWLPVIALAAAAIALLNLPRLESDGLLPALLWALGYGLGFLGALFLLEGIQRRLEPEHMPKAFRGLPIQLLVAGILLVAISLCVDTGAYLERTLARDLLAGTEWQPKASFTIHFTLIFFGLAVIFISQIFRIGREMQEEQDLTV